MPSEALFERMALIRAAEERFLSLFSEGKLTGTVHTCIGQEAIAVAVGAYLGEDDYVFAPHRCHGHFLAYGGPLDGLVAEVMGRETGVSGGCGGSQHLHYRRFFSNGIQGGIVGNAVGAALAQRLANTADIVVVFLGDGTLGEGLVYESLNFAALKHLPVLFVVENNRYAQTTPVEAAVSGSMVGRAEAFGIATGEIEWNDADALAEVFDGCFAYVRERREPFFQVVHTYRLAAHSKGDDFRDAGEIAAWHERDPLAILASRLGEKKAAAIRKRAKAAVDAAVRVAEAAPVSDAADLTAEAPATESWPAPYIELAERYGKCLNAALARMMEADPTVLVMGEDLLDPYGGAFGVTRGLSTRFPERVIATPISEAGIVAWGLGAALCGYHPIVEIMFGDFLALAADQILNHVAKYPTMYGRAVAAPLVIRTPMGGRRGYGPTHSQSIEKMFLGVPGLRVVAPSHLVDPGELLRRCVLESDSPTLFIENKVLYGAQVEPIRDGRLGDFYVRVSDCRFPTVSLSLVDFDGADAAIVCYGGMCAYALEAARALLLEHEIAADVVVPSLLAPTPVAAIDAGIGRAGLAVTAEEATVACGWGAEVIAALAARPAGAGRRYRRVGALPCPIPAAKPAEEAVLPNADRIVQAVLRELT